MQVLYITTVPVDVSRSIISKELAIKNTKSSLIGGDHVYHRIIGRYIQAWKQGNYLQTF